MSDAETCVKKRSRGRPPSDTTARFEALTGQPFDLASWPNPSSPCWFTAKSHTWLNGRPMPAKRAFFTLLVGRDMHPSWRLIQMCASRGCTNPHHHRLKAVNDVRFEFEPPPEHIMYAEAALAIEQPAESDEVEDVIDLILGIEDGRDMPASHFVERWSGAYDLETIELALARIREGRL